MEQVVIALMLYLNGKAIEWVYKPDIMSCLKSKRVAMRETSGGDRVVFKCEKKNVILEEDPMTRYGYRIRKIV
jgi:hypothetical protein